MKERPLFSVVIPSYNRSHLIAKTVRSVLDQRMADLELIVALDGCTDDTAARVVEAADGDPRLTLLELAHVGHPSSPRAAGVSRAQGRYIAYLDDDDLWEPHHLNELVRLFGTGARVVSSSYIRVDEAGEVTETCAPIRMCWHPELQTVDALFQPSTVAHTAGLAESVGGWRVGTGLEDWDLWYRFAEAGHDVQTSTAVTVRSLDTPTSRRWTLAQRETIPVASFASGRRARRAMEAMQEQRDCPTLEVDSIRDAEDWYDAMIGSPRFVFPIDFPESIPRTGASVVAEAHAMSRETSQSNGGWIDRLIVVPDAGGCRIGIAQLSERREHTNAIAAVYRQRMRRQLLWGARIARDHGATSTLFDQGRVPVATH